MTEYRSQRKKIEIRDPLFQKKEDWTIFGITQESITLDQLAQIVKEGVQNVDKINKNDVKEISRYATPSVVIKDVFGLLMIFFGHKEDWPEVVKFIISSGPRL